MSSLPHTPRGGEGSVTEGIGAVRVEEHTELGVTAMFCRHGDQLRVAYNPDKISRTELDLLLLLHADGYSNYLRNRA
jgi:hypothetical protein